MNKEKQSLVFFGSGPVAAESLRLLLDNFVVEAVITKPTTRSEMQAISQDLPLFTVGNKSELDELFIEQNFSSKLGVLIDFGIIVSQKIIDYFELGIINSHFSLLPELRGADPITFAILEGKQKTGVSLMLLVESMDEGPILGTKELELDGTETTPQLTNNLILTSNELLVELLPKYIDGSLQPKAQVSAGTSYTRKLKKSDGIIDWNKPAIEIEREIRAYSGWPKSTTKFSDIDCVITKAHVIDDSGNPGKLFIDDKKLGVYCGNQALIIDSIKPAGKNEMSSESFINGYSAKINL
jgi:methionyl-tRNA formyltransferase